MVYKRSTLSAKQVKIAKLKAKGHKNTEIGAIVYPNANPTSQRQLVSRELNKSHVAQYAQQSMNESLMKYNHTWDRIMFKLDMMMDADKMNQFTGEITPDYSIQLNAIKTIIPLLEKVKTLEQNKDQTSKLIDESDELELYKAVFRKNDNNSDKI